MFIRIPDDCRRGLKLQMQHVVAVSVPVEQFASFLTTKYIVVGYQLSPAMSLSKGPSAAAVSQAALSLRAELETLANLDLLSKIGGESFGQ